MGPQPLRVTVDGVARQLEPDEAAAVGAKLETHGAGATGEGWGTLRTPTARHRLSWQVHRSPGSAPGSGLVELEMVFEGWRFEVLVEPAARVTLRDRARRTAAAVHAHAPLVVRAPIPGRIGSVRAVDGQVVEAGETLLTLEAMKMENAVRAPRAGTISRVAVGTGQTVELGDALLELR